MHGKRSTCEKVYVEFYSQILYGSDKFADLGLDGSIILTWIVKKYDILV
jgi:hypothetical protein